MEYWKRYEQRQKKNHWHKWKLLYLNTVEFCCFVWKTILTIVFIRIYIGNDNDDRPSCWPESCCCCCCLLLPRYYDYLLFFINFIERKVHWALRDGEPVRAGWERETQPYLEKMMVWVLEPSRVAGIIFFFSFFCRRHNKCTLPFDRRMVRKKKSISQKCLYFSYACTMFLIFLSVLWQQSSVAFVSHTLKYAQFLLITCDGKQFYGNGRFVLCDRSAQHSTYCAHLMAASFSTRLCIF